MSDQLLYEVRDHVAYLTLNRPRVLNAISHDLDHELAERWNEIDRDPDIWVAVLAAAGERAFCAGADISGGAAASADRLAIGGGLTGVGGPLRRLTKPLIAAVQGYVLGAGFELAMCADIIVAADNAQFGLPEIKAGIIGDCGVVHRAVRQLPYRVAMAMILTSERLSAADAERFGLVNQVVPFEELADAAAAWAAKLTTASPLAQQAAKHAVLTGLDLPLPAALGMRYEPIEAYAHSLDAQEGNTARAEKRAPQWTGR
ncbi:enoyl-CoA hydratase-related protein [Streptomyces carpinensis]|uniref:Enoyl-CoA hydratase-related protein n=1 Tax=Streptomyces carpinensis TaxID=66369 RepID=A0ABV1VUR7_9ACTN|nr:enoyl-CoA hydratase-related protein [Streptomyces carpinensis]